MSKNIRKVLNGDFPKEALKKMNRKHLEQFVLRLVDCSNTKGSKNEAKDFTGLYRGLCLKEINKPEWWPSEHIISQSLTTDGKCFMEVLRFLVYKCCEFFKKPSSSDTLNNKLPSLNYNNENKRGIKRKVNDSPVPTENLKRRTLIPRNLSVRTRTASPVVVLNKSAVIPLQDILATPKPITKDAFLNIFGLQNTFTPNIDEDPSPTFITFSIKFNNCSHIPFSSDLGQELMKRDNHLCPEALKTRRLERLEWYVNKLHYRPNNIDYEITYQEKKDLFISHPYKFPKRQLWQHPGDMEFQKKALFVRKLNVVLVKHDLKKLQKQLKSKKASKKLKVVVPRLPLRSKKATVPKVTNFTRALRSQNKKE